jgi:hypothetical protein
MLPPPFRGVLYLVQGITWTKQKIFGASSSSTRSKKKGDDKMKSYMELLKKLVNTKIHSDAEALAVESFKALRVDLKNFIEGRVQKMEEKILSQIKSNLTEINVHPSSPYN